MSDEMIDHPSHYTQGGIEPIDYIEAHGMDFHTGCALKYLTRYPYKGTAVQDLRKAIWYIQRKIELLEKEK